MSWFKVSAEWEQQHYPLPTLDEEEEMSYFRRSAADRKAEAAAYRARTEAAAIPTVDLRDCDFRKDRKVLMLSANVVGMPRQFYVKSHYTGKEVRFVVIGPEDNLFDEDQWDGEQQIYRPTSDIPNVDHLVIFRGE